MMLIWLSVLRLLKGGSGRLKLTSGYIFLIGSYRRGLEPPESELQPQVEEIS